MSLFPIFVKMAQRPALVVGGGSLAIAKVDALLAAGAVVTVVAPKVGNEVLDRQRRGELSWLRRNFEVADVHGKAIVIAATGKREIDRKVFKDCHDAGIWCNAVDDPEFCDFYTPAIVRRGDLQIAISTNGQSPALAQQIRQELEGRFDAAWTTRIAQLGQSRREVLAKMAAGPERTAELHAQARAAMKTQNGGVLRRLGTSMWEWLSTEDERVSLI